MGTIREQILEASSLISGTIREHLANPNTGTGDNVLNIVMDEPDTIVVEQETMGVQLEEADFDVKIVEKITTITKE